MTDLVQIAGAHNGKLFAFAIPRSRTFGLKAMTRRGWRPALGSDLPPGPARWKLARPIKVRSLVLMVRKATKRERAVWEAEQRKLRVFYAMATPKPYPFHSQ